MKNLPVLILCLTFALGCGLSGKIANLTSNTGTSNGSSAGPTSSGPSSDPRDDVIRASRKFLDLPKFSGKMDGTGKNELHMKLDYVAPDRYHMYFYDPDGSVKTETIMIGNDMYIKAAGAWRKFPSMLKDNQMMNMRKMFDEQGLKTVQDVKYVGDDTIDGQKAYVYSYHNTKTDATIPYPFTSKIWIGASDDVPKKLEVNYEGGDLKTMTVIYDTSSNITIEPPV
jgi:hypothetical protein